MLMSRSNESVLMFKIFFKKFNLQLAKLTIARREIEVNLNIDFDLSCKYNLSSFSLH